MPSDAASFIQEFGDQAYHKAVELAVVAAQFGDTKGAKMFSDAAKELMQMGYHKKAKCEIPAPQRRTETNERL